MLKNVVALCLAAAAVCTVPARAAEQTSEDTLRVRLQSAVWPADIVRLSGEYRSRFPQSDFRASADALGYRAAEAMRALESKDVRLFRSAFTTPPETASLREDLRRAALADSQAALRIAHAHRDGAGLPADPNRYVGWLQYAANLGNDEASYELAVHYRRNAQIPLASLYEARAVELGYVLPRELDHFRK